MEKELERRRLEGSLLEYVCWSFEKKFKKKFIVNRHHVIICEHLERVFNGEIKNLVINIAPRYSKTEIAVKSFIEWCMARVSSSKFIHLSYSDMLALDNSSEIRESIKSDWYQGHWPLTVKTDADSKQRWNTKEGGGVYATGTMGSITGFGAGHVDEGFGGAIIIDDPLKPDEAYSETQRKKANQRLNSTIVSRRNNPSKTPIIIIMQRLHEEDMTGFVLSDKEGEGIGEKFVHLSLPALSDEGEPLWPFKHSREQLEQMKKADRRVFAAQMQQKPSPEEGNLFKRSMFANRYKQLPAGFHQEVQAWDFAVKDKQTSDFNVGLVGGRINARKYLIDESRRKADFPAACKMLIDFTKTHPRAHKKIVEDKANGSPVLQTLKQQVPGMVAVTPIHDKVFRANAVLPDMEAMDWWFPHSDICPWIEDFIDELCMFPNGKHDDRVDAFVMLAAEFQKATTLHVPLAGHGHG